jgi:PhnB protein
VKLVVDSADRAIAWYADALGAEPGERHEMDGRVVYAELRALGTTLTVKDADAHDPRSANLILEVLADQPDLVWKGLVEAGAAVVHPLEDQFYGRRAGRVRDPFGVQWIVSGPLSTGG